MASNTPHARLHAVRDAVSVPVISILDATAKAAAGTGATKALVLGTAFPHLIEALGGDLPWRTVMAAVSAMMCAVPTMPAIVTAAMMAAMAVMTAVPAIVTTAAV